MQQERLAAVQSHLEAVQHDMAHAHSEQLAAQAEAKRLRERVANRDNAIEQLQVCLCWQNASR